MKGGSPPFGIAKQPRVGSDHRLCEFEIRCLCRYVSNDNEDREAHLLHVITQMVSLDRDAHYSIALSRSACLLPLQLNDKHFACCLSILEEFNEKVFRIVRVKRVANEIWCQRVPEDSFCQFV